MIKQNTGDYYYGFTQINTDILINFLENENKKKIINTYKK